MTQEFLDVILLQKSLVHSKSWVSFLCGQAYDGAENIAGAVNGTALLICKEYLLALYLHCASHCLNVAGVTLGVTRVHNMIGVIGRVY